MKKIIYEAFGCTFAVILVLVVLLAAMLALPWLILETIITKRPFH